MKKHTFVLKKNVYLHHKTNIIKTKKNKKMKTKIYKSYEDFLRREDKKENGVSEDFAAKYPDFEKQNEKNSGCWNCYNCESCPFCDGCKFCKSLINK